MAKKTSLAKTLAHMEAQLGRAFRGQAEVRYKTASGKRGKTIVKSRVGDNLLDTMCLAEVGVKRSKKKLKLTSAKRGGSKLYLQRSYEAKE